MLQFKNDTPFDATLFLTPDADGVDSIVAIVKGTFALGTPLMPAAEQVKVAMAPEHYGDPLTTSLRVASDVALMKPATDVLLVGSAYAAGGRATPWMDVSIAVGNVRKTVRVFGDRRWRVTAAGTYAMSQPVPFETMPLVWERAYGGSDETPKGPVAETRNPVGVGFCSPKGNRQPVDLLVPNLEDPNSPIRSWKDTPPPTCFAPICEHWQPRLSYAGTYDQHWQTQRAPYLPADFDSRFFQLSPPGLIVDGHLRGGEWIEVIGATPSGLLQFRLPTDAPKIAFLLDGTEQLRPADLDTVIIEPDIQRVVLVWRAMLSCDKKALRVTEVRAGIQHAA